MSGKSFSLATLQWQSGRREKELSNLSMPHLHFSFPIAWSVATISKREENVRMKSWCNGANSLSPLIRKQVQHTHPPLKGGVVLHLFSEWH